MGKVRVDAKRCKGCFLCMSVCPANAISVSGELSEKGYETIRIDEVKCIQCGSCYTVCPDQVFTVYGR